MNPVCNLAWEANSSTADFPKYYRSRLKKPRLRLIFKVNLTPPKLHIFFLEPMLSSTFLSNAPKFPRDHSLFFCVCVCVCVPKAVCPSDKSNISWNYVRSICGMIVTGQNQSTRRQACPSATSTNTNITRTELGSNPCLLLTAWTIASSLRTNKTSITLEHSVRTAQWPYSSLMNSGVLRFK